MILGALFRSVESAGEIDLAFRAFDAVRRPRAQRVIDSSRGTGRIMCGMDPEAGLDRDKLAAALGERWGFIFGLDMEAHKKDALNRFRDFKSV